jgi:hypothetical protein
MLHQALHSASECQRALLKMWYKFVPFAMHTSPFWLCICIMHLFPTWAIGHACALACQIGGEDDVKICAWHVWYCAIFVLALLQTTSRMHTSYSVSYTEVMIPLFNYFMSQSFKLSLQDSAWIAQPCTRWCQSWMQQEKLQQQCQLQADSYMRTCRHMWLYFKMYWGEEKDYNKQSW